MANTKYILEKIKLEGEIHDLLVKSNAENVAVTWKEQETTLAAALADIFASITSLPTAYGVDSKISAAISELIGGAPETYDTFKELADYIESHKSVETALNAAIGNKVDKEDGKGLSANDFTDALKTALEGLSALGLTAEKVSAWDNKAEKTVATADANGLMSKEDKAKLDGLRGVRYGTEVPDDMQNGEMFVRIVSEV